jgi:hypothetical protein
LATTIVQNRELPGCIRVAAVFDVEDLASA